VPQFGGGIENIQFLGGEGPTVAGQKQLQENAETAMVFATFWIEKVTHKQNGHSFMQLQYAQMVVLNFKQANHHPETGQVVGAVIHIPMTTPERRAQAEKK
jgi:hypothetical protein